MRPLSDIELVALDLDDTTLRSDSTLAPETREAIIAATDAGIEVVIASGRAFNSLPEEVVSISGISYAITSNGAAVELVPSGERVFELTLREDSIHALLELFEGELMSVFVRGQAYCDAAFYSNPLAFGCASAYVDYIKTTRLPVENMRSFILEHINELESVDLQCSGAVQRDRLREAAETLPNVYVTSSAPTLVEISDALGGKGASLRRLCRMLSIPAEHTVAFGNGDNDADMLSFAGIGAAVGNATEACKAAADVVLESNDDGAVGKFLRRIIGG